MKKLISERYIRKFVRKVLLEAAPTVSVAEAQLKTHRNTFDAKLVDSMKAQAMAPKVGEVFFRNTAIGGDPGGFLAKLQAFEVDFINYLNALDNGVRTAVGGDDIASIIRNLVAEIGGTMSIPATTGANLDNANKALLDATD